MTPLIVRRLLVLSRSKKSDSRSTPVIHCASKRPMGVSIPSRVCTNACGKPSALLLSTMALFVPGPHQRFSVATPVVSHGTSTETLLWPAVVRCRCWSPNRYGRSIDDGDGWNGLAQTLRAAAPPCGYGIT